MAASRLEEGKGGYLRNGTKTKGRNPSRKTSISVHFRSRLTPFKSGWSVSPGYPGGVPRGSFGSSRVLRLFRFVQFLPVFSA